MDSSTRLRAPATRAGWHELYKYFVIETTDSYATTLIMGGRLPVEQLQHQGVLRSVRLLKFPTRVTISAYAGP